MIYFKKFFERPYGGMELETYLAVVEISWGIILFFSDFSIWQNYTLKVFYNHIPGQLIAIPWFIAGILNVVGIQYFFYDKLISSKLRWYGALLSLIIWSWMTIFSLLTVTALLSVMFYICSAIAALRIMISAAIQKNAR